MLSGYDIVCLSTQDWHGLWTRKQRFMQMFAENGNRVLYVETPVHLLGLDVLPHDPDRFFRFLKGPRRLGRNLHVATLPILLPFFQMSHAINAANQAVVAFTLRRWMRRLGFAEPLLWVYTPFSSALVDSLRNECCIYECVDEFRAAKGFVRSNVIGNMEDELLHKCNVAIVTQESLLPRRQKICPQTFCIPNGADTELFARIAADGSRIPEVIDRIPRPRFGFVGLIQYWVDLKLIGFIARNRPDWSIVLIGPLHPLADAADIKDLRNIHLIGKQPQAEIPRLLKGIDVCLNPYKPDDVAKHASPLKLYEYLAAGKPVVSTEMPEARKFETVVRIAREYPEFLEQCIQAIKNLPEPQSVIESRLASVSDHSWKNRFARVNEVVSAAIKTKLTREANPN
jgi:glycosyltransferase involved in cell wall biosynthesis